MSDFKLETNENTSLILLPARLTEKEVADFKGQINGWLLAPVDFFVMDFKNTVVFDRQFYQAFLQFRSILKNSDKNVYSVNLTPTLLAQVKNDGLDQALSPVEGLEAAQKSFLRDQSAKKQIDLEFIKPFLKGVKSAFEIQCQTPIQVQKPFIKIGPIENVAIAATISFSSENMQGNAVLSFPEAVFLKTYENMFETKLDAITKESEDAAAELLNMTYGAAKIDLNQRGYGFLKALPTVLHGSQIANRPTKGAATVVIPFECAGGFIYLEIETEEH